ncbi:DUF2249 domain-containing protein [Knoellia locipacati]|uniref:DUF2249 domain-containing protein n=1 Tax=Knoellia locipacati TaxID=882824 RepID=UPI00384CBE7B
MNTVVVASSEQDSSAVEAVKQHHAQMAGTLAGHVTRIAAAPDDASALLARDHLVEWAEHDLVPHAKAEESAMYPLAHADERARLLVDAMLVEHQLILGLVGSLRSASDRVHAAAEARALAVTFDSHLAKENDQILPLLAGKSDVSLADALAGMHELLGGHEGHDDHGHDDHGHDLHGHHAHGDTGGVRQETSSASATGGCGGGCACGESDGPEYPELDARTVPHAIRHATIFGALDAVQPGGGLVLVAPHDPLPLLRQLEGREPGAFSVDYLERGPEAWRLLLQRAGA